MRFFDFVRRPWWQRAWLLPVIIVVYIGALLWVALISWRTKATSSPPSGRN
jgi:ABC-type Fe3+ transport system permease subunit